MMEFDQTSRRSYLKYATAGIGAGIASATAGCSDIIGDDDSDLDSMDMLWTEDSMAIPVALAGEDVEAWEDEGIDLDVTVTGYGRYSQAIQQGEANINNLNAAIYMNAYRDDEDIVLVGATETQVNGAFVREESDIESLEDFEDQHIGMPPRSTGTSMLMLSMIQDELGIDDLEDYASDVTYTDPPVLQELLTEDEDIDVMFQFTGFTIQGRAEGSPVRQVFDPDEYWEDRTGENAIISFWGADRDWLENNPQQALDFLQGWENARDHTMENTSDVVDQYGALAGFTADEELAVYEDVLEEGAMPDIERWDDDMVDAQFDILDLMVEFDFYDDRPDIDDDVFTHSELEDMAEDS